MLAASRPSFEEKNLNKMTLIALVLFCAACSNNDLRPGRSCAVVDPVSQPVTSGNLSVVSPQDESEGGAPSTDDTLLQSTPRYVFEIAKPGTVSRPSHYDPSKRPKTAKEVADGPDFSGIQAGQADRPKTTATQADELRWTLVQLKASDERISMLGRERDFWAKRSSPEAAKRRKEIENELAEETKFNNGLQARAKRLSNDTVEAVLLEKTRAGRCEPMPFGESSFGSWDTGSNPLRP